MAKAFHMIRLAAALFVAAGLMLSGMAGGALAGPPKPARGQGDACVAPTDWMRKNHMSVLKHQRDDTVHLGVRTKTFSLKGCIDCHAVAGADGKAVTVADPKHFCRTCHDYAAVRMDCFECHASRPEDGEVGKVKTGAADSGVLPAGHPAPNDVAALAAYLKEAGQ
ncbi:MAG: cytochrome c3 family protein [Hyphomicrobiaceae bacterium]